VILKEYSCYKINSWGLSEGVPRKPIGLGLKFKGTQAQMMSKYQNILAMRSSFSKGYIL
jgi:hypothetical protein